MLHNDSFIVYHSDILLISSSNNANLIRLFQAEQATLKFPQIIFFSHVKAVVNAISHSRQLPNELERN